MDGVSITMDTISVAGETPPPPPSPGGGGLLPGGGSYGDPIRGLGQSNAQMKDTLSAFTATLNATNTLNAGLEAGNVARNADQRSQLAAGFDAAQTRRETMFAAPPVTGPILPPNFAETARVPGQPAFDLNGPVPSPGPPDTGAAPETAPAAGASAATGQAAAGIAAAPAFGLGRAAADMAADAAAAAGRTAAGLLLRGGSLAGAYFGLGTGSIPSQTAETAMQLGGSAFDPTPLAEQPAPLVPPDLPAGFATPPTTAPPPLTLAQPGPGIAAEPLPGLKAAPSVPGLEGLTPIAPGGFGLLPGFLTAPPQAVTLPGLTPAGQTPPLPEFGAADPGLVGGQSFENRVPRPFTSKDPLVGDLANTLEAALPGLVADANVDVLGADGKKVTDYDILLNDGTVIQVKAGRGKGLTSQMDRTAATTGQRVIAYGPKIGGTLEMDLKQRGYEVYRTPQSLIDALSK